MGGSEKRPSTSGLFGHFQSHGADWELEVRLLHVLSPQSSKSDPTNPSADCFLYQIKHVSFPVILKVIRVAVGCMSLACETSVTHESRH